MSIHVLCPTCGKVCEFHLPPVTQCFHCHRSLPDSIRDASDRTLLQSSSPKPGLLVIGQWWSLLAALMIIALLASAPFGAGSYRINNVAVAGPVFLRQAGLAFGAIGFVLLGVAYGLFFNHRWVRPLMVVYWPVVFGATFTMSGAPKSDDLVGAVSLGIVACGAVWYLYRRPNVRAYFEMLSRLPRRRDA